MFHADITAAIGYDGLVSAVMSRDLDELCSLGLLSFGGNFAKSLDHSYRSSLALGNKVLFVFVPKLIHEMNN